MAHVANVLNGHRVRIHAMRRNLAACDRHRVGGAQPRHPGPHLRRRAAEVRQEDDVRQVGEARGEPGSSRTRRVPRLRGRPRGARRRAPSRRRSGPRGVDEIAVGFIAARGSRRPDGGCGERNVQGQEVAAFDEFLPAHLADRIRQAGQFRFGDGPPGGWSKTSVHAERGRPVCGGPGDPPEADESERGPETSGREAVGFPAGNCPDRVNRSASIARRAVARISSIASRRWRR